MAEEHDATKRAELENELKKTLKIALTKPQNIFGPK